MSHSFSTDLERIKHLPEGPLKMARFTLWWLRKTFFEKEKPPNPAVYVDLSEDEIIQVLGREHFEPGWEISYSYRNEAINLRRVEYRHDPDFDQLWWQVHIRGYEHDDGRFELAAHLEVEPTEHPRAHLNNVGLDVARGNQALMEVLDEKGIEYEYLNPDGSPVSEEDSPEETTPSEHVH